MRACQYKMVGLLYLIALLIIVLASLYGQRIDIRSFQIGKPLETLDRYDRSINQTKLDVTSVMPEDYLIPNDTVLSRLNISALTGIYWRYVNMLQVLCKDVIRVGNLKDGGKEICADSSYKPTAPCLVYSFGINNRYDFDNDVVKLFGCDVHCFDPSMKDETHRVSEHIWFYKWGLGGVNHINSKNWEIKTLDTIRQELGHTNRTIDLLKMDIEGGEWNSIPQMVTSGALSDVRQIAMETHFKMGMTTKGNKTVEKLKEEPYEQLSALRQLYDYGYRLFMRDRNLVSRRKLPGSDVMMTRLNEISMIKEDHATL